MSLTLTKLKIGHMIGGLEFRLFDVLFDNSYATGGKPIDGSEVGINIILGALDVNAGVGDGAFRFKYDLVNKKLLAFRAPSGTLAGNVVVKGGGIGEAVGINPDSNAGVLSKAAATDRTIPVATFLGGAMATAAASLVEVGNGVDLSAITARILFIG